MEQFWVDPEDIEGEFLYLREPEVHHIKDVLRHKKGDILNLFDGEGGVYQGEILDFEKRRIKVKILSKEYRKKKPPFFHLVQAIPKKDKMDFIVEKATELGVDEIIPVITERTIVRPSKEKEKILLERWRKISLAAVKQSGRIFMPCIEEIENFSQVLEKIPKDGVYLIPYVEEKKTTLKKLEWEKFKSKKDIYFFIGPEGDFSPREIKLAKSRGFIPLTLGEAVLKSDTASLYLLSVLNYELR
ncbi:MAG: 16S rRNA (uracil(1498)-N(3))-methyltransferase [Candidatus Omnitrophota bacterium]